MKRTTLTCLAIWIIAFPLLCEGVAADQPESADAAASAIYQRIEKLRRIAANLRVDGDDRDWAGIPQFSDPRGDAGGDSHRDLVAAAVAPTDTDLWVMLRTAGTPSADRWVFYLVVDMVGDHGADFRIEIDLPQAKPTLRLIDESGKLGAPIRLWHAEVAIRRVVEIRIPYSDIADALPPAQAPLVSGKEARPWVRVQSVTWDNRLKKIVDYGPSVASYRLVETPYPLEPPLPERPRPPIAIPPPLRGQWFVAQGAFGSRSHQQTWAYDLVVLDQTGYESTPVDSKQTADSHAWGRPVLAPVDGVVLRAKSDIEDSPIHTTLDPSARANQVLIRAAEGFAVDLLHLQQGSVTVEPGARVTAGQQIARVGNSGSSNAPHLHLALWAAPMLRRTTPLALRNVRVGLNPVPDDPWVRQLSAWEPREGYFFEAIAATAATAPNTTAPQSDARP